jgi:hypothetical protein
MRQKPTGHASDEVHELYTQHELDTLRDAVTKLSRVTTD